VMIHKLKIKPEYLQRLVDGTKKAEIRINDRDYQVGDILEFFNILRNVCVGDPDFYLKFKITHIHSSFGLEKNYACLSVEIVKK